MSKLKIMTNRDYVRLYANKMKNDNKYFKQHKMLIESQLKASSSLFKNSFGVGEDFKTNARKYLKEIKMIK